MSDRVAFLGCGSWGAALSSILAEKGIKTNFWHRDSQVIKEMEKSRKHYLLPSIEFSDSVKFFSNLNKAIEGVDTIVVAVPSQNVREVLTNAQKTISASKCIINISKGIENNSLMTMSEVINDVLKNKSKIVTLSGPSHAEEVIDKNPTAIVSSSKNLALAEYVQELFSTKKFRVYTNTDIRGVEIGGSAKNVIAIAAGFCDGAGYGDNTKAALITRGLNEISLLGKKLGAKSKTFFGLAGIGDLVVTCYSIHSRNRKLGELVGRGEDLSKILSQSHMIAEGVKTADSIYSLRNKLNIEMPICESVYRVLFNNSNPVNEVSKLMTRNLRSEY
tara:strand:+ start:1167 stop:2162 length:996 start_codon:yes stop_codon:yes gene_type:complete